MRCSESKIKAAILHPEAEVRAEAVHYFSDARCDDETVMPLAIEAVEKHGRELAFPLLRAADRLPQTEATVEWLINELRQDYDLADVDEDNYRFAVALVLCGAPQPILTSRLNGILTAPAFPQQLVEPLQQRLQMFTWDWDRAWTALKDFGTDTLRRNDFTQNDVRYANRLVEALARHREEKASDVLALLEHRYGNEDETLMDWLLPAFVDLTGAMRLEESIPLLVNFLADESDLSTSDSAATALERIGTDAVVREFDVRWWDGDAEFCSSAACVLDHIRGDLCAEKSLAFFHAEKDPEIQLLLADALLGNYCEDAVEEVRQLLAGIDDEDLEPDRRDLRYRLVAVATIMGMTFPQFDDWHDAALRDNWGWFDRKAARLADAFQPDQPGPRISGNGKKF